MIRHLVSYLSLALAVTFCGGASVAGAGCSPTRANQPAKAPVALKFSVRSQVDLATSYTIPGEPPLVSQKVTGAGEAELLGKFITVEHVFLTLDVHGNPIREEVVGALTTASGDALYYKLQGLSQTISYIWTITGGKGRFLGATGSGVMNPELKPMLEKFTGHFEGKIVLPRSVR
jgi:hypothetical protein